MGMCEYCIVKGYDENCLCSKTQNVCPMVRRCSDRHTWLPLDNMGKCAIRNQINRKEGIVLKDKEYLVQSVQGKKLYIETDKGLVRIINPFDYVPDKVKLIEGENGYEIEMPKEEKAEEIKESKEPKEDYKKSKKKK